MAFTSSRLVIENNRQPIQNIEETPTPNTELTLAEL